MNAEILDLESDLGDRIMMMDPHGGHETISRTSARGSIVVVARDYIDRFWVLDTYAARCTTDQLVDRFFELNARWRPYQARIESAGQQTLFVDSVRREAQLRRIKINVLPHPVTTTAHKEHRIREILHLPWAEGRIIIRDDQMELRSELRGFPLAETCDLVDALASCVSAFPPSTTAQLEREARDNYAEYLTDMNVPKWYRDSELKQMDSADQNPAHAPLGLRHADMLQRERER